MALDLVSVTVLVVIVVVVTVVGILGYQLYQETASMHVGASPLLGPVAVLPPLTGTPALTTPTGLPPDPLADYWDDPAINFPGAPTQPIPAGLRPLAQAPCPWQIPNDPYHLAAYASP